MKLNLDLEIHYGTRNEIYFLSRDYKLYMAQNLQAYINPNSPKARFMLVTSDRPRIEEIIEQSQVYSLDKRG